MELTELILNLGWINIVAKSRTWHLSRSLSLPSSVLKTQLESSSPSIYWRVRRVDSFKEFDRGRSQHSNNPPFHGTGTGTPEQESANDSYKLERPLSRSVCKLVGTVSF